MTAIHTHVFGVARSTAEKANPMGAEKTDQGMADFTGTAGRFQEAMAAVARVLDKAVA